MASRSKRLTVIGADSSEPGVSKTATEGGHGKIAKAGLSEAFSNLNGFRAVSITSVTDKDLARRKSFSSKDEEIITPDGGDAKQLKEWAKSTGISWSCKKGMKPESPNQDSFSILLVENEFALYGVYDGHGPDGHDVSDMARIVLVKLFISHPSRTTNPGVALREAFIETQKALETSEISTRASASGTTCTMAYHDIKKATITIAHVGDSRSVLGKGKDKAHAASEVEDMTIDHKPNLEKERKRIESANPPGRVVFDGYYNHRVFAQNGMYPGLNMSRALGDIVAHQEAGLTAEPDVKVINVKAEKGRAAELTLLLCTDGVWEFIESKEAVTIAHSKDTPDHGVESLAKESYDRWMKDSENEISDDITAIMIRL